MDIEIAKKYHNSGLSVVPMGADKLPRLATGSMYAWKSHQSELIEPDDRFAGAAGIAVVCGKISGGLECIDIDTKYDLTGTLFNEFKQLIQDNAPGLPKKFVVQKTPSGGYHFLYRCVEVPIEGNQKIANRESTAEERAITVKKYIASTNEQEFDVRDEKARRAGEQDKVRVLIETRGEGGYFGVFPSAGYEVVYGSIENIQTITAAEREVIFACAQSFNQVFEEVKLPKQQEQTYSANKSPFEDYNENCDVQMLLEANGWTLKRTTGHKYYFLRPGGEQMWSAEYDGSKRLFYVFTTSSQFDGNKAYNASQVLTILNFKGDYSAAAKWLISEGYGDQRPAANSPYKQNAAPVAQLVNKDDDNYDFLSPEEETDDYIVRKRNGTFKMGNKTGWVELDKHFRFKAAQLDMVLGHDNAGKTIVTWYLSVLDCLYNNAYYIVYCGENTTGGAKCRLMEYYLCKIIEKMNELEYKKAKDWVEKHYAFIRNDEPYSYQDMINIAWKMLKKKAYTKFIIEPYNMLDKQTNNEHQYDYQAMKDFRLFIRKSGMGITLNVHAATEALRKTYGKEHDHAGYVMPPNKSDAEGGGKFPNKADNFLVVHRMSDHPTEWVWTEIHVQKIKEYETGGSRTFKNEPFKIRMVNGGCGFEDEKGNNPVFDWHEKNSQDVKIDFKPNTNFVNEVPKSLVDSSSPVHMANSSDDHEDQPF